MNKKKSVILFSIIIFLLFIGIIVVYYSSKKNNNRVKSAEEDHITRYEWMEMLCEQTGITEYQNDTPYFSDTEKDSIYYPYLQSAVEHEVLDADADFGGENFASGKFAALTAMKTIGERKLQIYLDTKNSITDDYYIKLAVEHGLIEEEQLSKGVSLEESEQIIAALKSLYFSEFWKDDYSNVIYQDGVIELSLNDVLQSNDDCSEIVVAEDIWDSLKTGTILVFEQENTKLKVAREITKINSDGTLLLNSVGLEQAVESLTVSDITELSFADIVNYYGLEADYDTRNTSNTHLNNEKLVNLKTFPFEMNSEGYKLILSTEDEDEEKYLKIQVEDNATGVSYTLPVKYEVEEDSTYNVEINIDKICIGGQADYSALNILPNYAEVAVDAHATYKGTIQADTEKKILLFKTPVPLGNNLAGVDIQLYLVLSAEGSISFEAELPAEMAICFEKDTGFKRLKQDISIEEPSIEANCDVSALLRFEPTLIILGIDIIDGEVDVGVAASANVVTQPNSQLCADVSISCPVLTISACGDDNADTIVGNYGFSAEWDIISPENAPFQFGMHYELLPDKTGQFVEECTYHEPTNEPANTGETIDEDIFVNTFTTWDGNTKFSFDYPNGWTATVHEPDSTFKHSVDLENGRGAIVQYWEQMYDGSLGAQGHASLVDIEITKAADSAIEGFMVGKVQTIGGLDMITGEEYILEDGAVSYAVVPESYAGIHKEVGVGRFDELSFLYNSVCYIMWADFIGGRFTEEEAKEVIGILSSFRVVEETDVE